jgi:5-methylcytosine-specific restriction endonuclease McrA
MHYDADHTKPEDKSANLSEIENAAARAKEWLVAQVLCIICHRLKTFWENHPEGKWSSEAKTHGIKCLREKYQRFVAEGGCAGVAWRPGETPTCPHSEAIRELLEKLNEVHKRDPLKMEPTGALSPELLLMRIAFDWDHLYPLNKVRVVYLIYDDAERALEIEDCQLLCVFCHRVKTYLSRDNVSRACSRKLLLPFGEANDDDDDDDVSEIDICDSDTDDESVVDASTHVDGHMEEEDDDDDFSEIEDFFSEIDYSDVDSDSESIVNNDAGANDDELWWEDD